MVGTLGTWFRAHGSHPEAVFVGDSLTAGEHASSRCRSYPALVGRELGADAGREVACRVTAVPGARVRDLAVLALPLASRVVVVEAGTNDWLGYRAPGPWSATAPDDFADAYRRLLDRVDDGRAVALLCLGIWAPTDGRETDGLRGTEYDAIIRAACELRGGCFVSLAPVYDDRRCRGPAGRATPFGVSDAVHPNDRGHAAIAELLMDALRGTRLSAAPAGITLATA
ncbi:MAG: SGNH/GDSL hydrolase family protein [Candidatus Dormibacteria bacterium]